MDFAANLSQGPFDVRPASKGFLRWAEAQGLPSSTVALLGKAWIQEDDCPAGSLELMSESQIMAFAKKEPRWIAAGFLVFGACLNGAMVAFDLREVPGSASYLSHGELWGDEAADPRKFSARVASDIRDLVEPVD